jgi:hypothetical protein
MKIKFKSQQKLLWRTIQGEKKVSSVQALYEGNSQVFCALKNRITGHTSQSVELPIFLLILSTAKKLTK